jgi:hypothetical protein
MSETRPRDLNPEELALLQVPAVRVGESMPLRIPPGMHIAIELLNPVAGAVTPATAPTAGPPDATGAVGGDVFGGTAPTQNPPNR